MNPASQMQGMKPSELNSGPESQGTKFILFNPGPHLQGRKSSQLTPEIKFPEAQFLENHFGAEQQAGQLAFTLCPQLNGVKSVISIRATA